MSEPAGIVQRWTIGQAEDCDVRVQDQYASGHHCQVVRLEDGRLMVCDLGSTNGTRLRLPDGRELGVYGWTPWVSGQSLVVGHSTIPQP